MLKVKNLYKSFADKLVLKDVSLQVNTGDVVAIIGPSGSGKTTFLRCINFLERADQGQIILDEQLIDVTKASKQDINLLRKKTAFIFQNYNLYSNKTALKNVTEGLIIGRKMPKAEAIAIAKQCLDKVGLADKYDYYPNQLSGGQQQRVGIARAIAVNPEVILIDEPTSSLDPELTIEILEILKQLAAEGTTMVIVTHEMLFAKDVAKHVVFMDEGMVIEQGSPEQIFSSPTAERTKQFLNKMVLK